MRPGKYWCRHTVRKGGGRQVQDKGKPKEHLFYVATYFPGTLDKSQAIEVEVRSGEEAAANFGVLTSHMYRVSGSVTGAAKWTDGADVSDFEECWRWDGEPGAIEGANRFEFQNVLPGTYAAMMIVVKGIWQQGGRRYRWCS